MSAPASHPPRPSALSMQADAAAGEGQWRVRGALAHPADNVSEWLGRGHYEHQGYGAAGDNAYTHPHGGPWTRGPHDHRQASADGSGIQNSAHRRNANATAVAAAESEREILVRQLERELQRVIVAMGSEKTAQNERASELVHELRIARAQRDALSAADANRQQKLHVLESELASAVGTLERERRAWAERTARMEAETAEARAAAEAGRSSLANKSDEVVALKRRLAAEERSRATLQEQLNAEAAAAAANAEAHRRSVDQLSAALRAAESSAEGLRAELSTATERGALLERQAAGLELARQQLEGQLHAADVAASERLKAASQRVSEEWETRMKHVAAEHEAALARAERGKDAAVADTEERLRRHVRSLEDRIAHLTRERDDAHGRLQQSSSALMSRVDRIGVIGRASVDMAASLREMLGHHYEDAVRVLARLTGELRTLSADATTASIGSAQPLASAGIVNGGSGAGSNAASANTTPIKHTTTHKQRGAFSPSSGPFTDRALNIARTSLSPPDDRATGIQANTNRLGADAYHGAAKSGSSPVTAARPPLATGRADLPRALFGPSHTTALSSVSHHDAFEFEMDARARRRDNFDASMDVGELRVGGLRAADSTSGARLPANREGKHGGSLSSSSTMSTHSRSVASEIGGTKSAAHGPLRAGEAVSDRRRYVEPSSSVADGVQGRGRGVIVSAKRKTAAATAVASASSRPGLWR